MGLQRFKGLGFRGLSRVEEMLYSFGGLLLGFRV